MNIHDPKLAKLEKYSPIVLVIGIVSVILLLLGINFNRIFSPEIGNSGDPTIILRVADEDTNILPQTLVNSLTDDAQVPNYGPDSANEIVKKSDGSYDMFRLQGEVVYKP